MTIKAVYNCIVCLVKAERQEKALMVVTLSQTKRAEINQTEQAELEKIEKVTATPSQRETSSNGSLEPEDLYNAWTLDWTGPWTGLWTGPWTHSSSDSDQAISL